MKININTTYKPNQLSSNPVDKPTVLYNEMIIVFKHVKSGDQVTIQQIGEWTSPERAVMSIESKLDDESGFYLLDRGDIIGSPSIWNPGERAAICWFGWEGYQPTEWYTYQLK